MVTDPVADLLIQIKNGYQAYRPVIAVPHSKVKEALAEVFVKVGFLEQVKTEENGWKTLKITLKYSNKLPVLTDVKRISKPGKRVYVTNKALSKVTGGLGIAIISTPKGLMTHKEAKKQQLGGEVICKIW